MYEEPEVSACFSPTKRQGRTDAHAATRYEIQRTTADDQYDDDDDADDDDDNGDDDDDDDEEEEEYGVWQGVW